MDSDDAWFLALTLLSGGVTVAWILVGRRRRFLGAALLIAILLWVVVWAIGYGVANSDWGNARLSGWADCWPHCDAWDGVAYWLLVGPPVACVVAVIAAGVVALIDRRK